MSNNRKTEDSHGRPGLPWQKLNHLAMAFTLGVILTAAIFLTTPLGKQAPTTPSAYDSRRRAEATSHNATQGDNATASDQPQPVDPQEQLRQIQAINDYNRRLTQPGPLGLPTDPAGTPLPPDPTQPPSSHGPPPGP